MPWTYLLFNEDNLLTPGARSKVHVKKILEASLLSIVTGSRSGQVPMFSQFGSSNESHSETEINHNQ